MRTENATTLNDTPEAPIGTKDNIDCQLPITPKKLVGRQAGFTLAFLIGNSLAGSFIVTLLSTLTSQDVDNPGIVAWAQLLNDPLPVILIFAVAQSLYEADSKITGENTTLHLHWHTNTPMTAIALIAFVLVLFVIGTFDSGNDFVVDSAIHAMNLKMNTSASQISALMRSPVSILGAILVAPICEEIVFRGVIMENLRRYGPTFAIVTSALLFGMMHGDIEQSISAILAGLLFGYVAYRYSLTWSIVLHASYNTLCTAIYWIPNPSFSTYLNAFGILAAIILLIAAILRRADIKAAFQSHPSPKGIWRAWLSPLFLLTLAFCVIVMVSRFSIS